MPRNSRITIASTVKPVSRSHYRTLKFPCSLHQVVTNNGLQYQYYDDRRKQWISEQVEIPSYSDKCQKCLPASPYQTLEYAVNSTIHSQNKVLAGQTECSSGISIHEFITYGSLRADGEKTQWPNICRELGASNITLNSDSVTTLMTQAAWQAGSSGTSTLRNSHDHFEDNDFCNSIRETVANLLSSIEPNRQSEHTMSIIITILLRTLSLTNCEDAATETFKLLRRCRDIALRWSHCLNELLGVITCEKQIGKTRRSILRTALLCKSTYNVDLRYIPKVLSTSKDAHCWIISSMLIHDNVGNDASFLSKEFQRLYVKITKLSHFVDSRLHCILSSEAASGLDEAIVEVWSAFRPAGMEWKSSDLPTDRCLQKQTHPAAHGTPQTVAYNTLRGELLVDGRPLGRLPRDYSSHKDYQRLLGAQIIRVSMSDMPSMEYMSANEEHNHLLYFAKRADSLVIRARHDPRVLQLIPHHFFQGDLPTIFVEDYVHWLDLDSGEVEFRPLKNPWSTDSQNWILRYRPTSSSYLQSAATRLVDMHSPTCNSTLQVLSGLEAASFMHLTVAPENRFYVFLPRLSLHFQLNRQGQLECPELRKIVDPNQGLGTLVGLKSRLVLCAAGDRSRALDRTVLIPEGTVSTNLIDNHVTVQVKTSGREIRYLRYRFNYLLQRLEGGGSLQNGLYQAYLHALTSNILPDPLTGQTGVEVSLQLLKQQIRGCHRPLDHAEFELLSLVSALTPHRVHYPKHLKVMQQVRWRKDMPSLNQIEDFAILADKLVRRANKFEVFSLDVRASHSLEGPGDWSLLTRAKSQNSRYRRAEDISCTRDSFSDKIYQSRALTCCKERSIKVFRIASLIANWSHELDVSPSLSRDFHNWGTVKDFDKNFEFSQSASDLLRLDLAASWGSLYKFSRNSNCARDKYKMLFTFVQLAYVDKPERLRALETLLAFATISSLQSLPPFPGYPSFTLRRGSSADKAPLERVIGSNYNSWRHSRPNLTGAERQDEHSQFQRTCTEKRRAATLFYQEQWPCMKPTNLDPAMSTWIKVEWVSREIQGLFAVWYQNYQCETHLREIQRLLDTVENTDLYLNYAREEWQQCQVVKQHSLKRLLPNLSTLMVDRNPPRISLPPSFVVKRSEFPRPGNSNLRSIVNQVGSSIHTSKSGFRNDYRSDLLSSWMLTNCIKRNRLQ